MAHASPSNRPLSSQSPAGLADSDLTNLLPESIQDLPDGDEDDSVNEQSPLLPPNGSSPDGRTSSPLDDVVQWLGTAYEIKSSKYMFLLTLGAFGYVFYYCLVNYRNSLYVDFKWDGLFKRQMDLYATRLSTLTTR